VADEKLWRGVVLAEPPGGEPEVVEVGGEVGVGEIAFARTEAGEVEPEDADAVPIEFGRDAPGCDDVLGTCEAVSEQCKGVWRAGGKVEPAGTTVMPACVAMFTEEVGVSPLVGDGGIYRSRVAELKGTLQLESVPGRGTTVTLRVPLKA